MIKELWNKKSFQRMFLNDKVENLDIENKMILDIGGGDKKSSYHKILRNKGNEFISVDITDSCDYKVDLEIQRLPFEDNSQEIIFCFNVMEHIFNYQNLLDEIYRVLKEDGKFYFYVPFLFHRHAHPYDYFRFSDAALEKLFFNTGFNVIQKELNYGIGKNIFQNLLWIFTSAKLFIIGRILNVIAGIALYSFDLFLNMFNKTNEINKNYTIGTYLVAKKDING